jgi:hypothetical protein
MHKIIRPISILVIAITAPLSAQASSQWKIPSNHIPVRCTLRADAGFEISIGFAKKDIKPENDDGSWWGLHSSLDNYVIDTMKVDGQSSEVLPRKYFAFLSNPNDMRLKKAPYGYLLTIIGGDGGESYVCEFQFRLKDKVTKRIVYNPSFPDETKEEFVFSERSPETN